MKKKRTKIRMKTEEGEKEERMEKNFKWIRKE
jgi:hypothetical protein